MEKRELKIVKRLGEGGSSHTFLAVDDKGIKYTIKKAKHKNDNIRKLLGFENEAVILEKINHPSVPKLVEKLSDGIILEYCEGKTLEKILLEKGTLSERETARIAKELTDILAYLHSKDKCIVYRDIKPANIIIDNEGHVNLIDFGAARIYKPGEQNDTQNLGTLGFAAPEQFGNLGQTDPRTDIYCLGMTMLLMISGVDIKDFEKVKRYKINGINNVSKEFMDIIAKCTRPDRNDRFKKVQEIAAELERYPARVRKRKAKRNIRIVSLAVVMSFTISVLISYGNDIKTFAVTDLGRRLPAVEKRIGYARLKIGSYIDDILGEE